MISKTRFSYLSDVLAIGGTVVHGVKNRSSVAKFVKRQKGATGAALLTRLFWEGGSWPCRGSNADTVDTERIAVL